MHPPTGQCPAGVPARIARSGWSQTCPCWSRAPCCCCGNGIAVAGAQDDPTFAGVATPQGRLRIEILQQSVAALRDTALAELGPELDVGIGFNAADGD